MNLGQRDYFTEVAPFFQLIFDPKTDVRGHGWTNDDMVWVNHIHRDEFVTAGPRYNPILASWVTGQARLRLYVLLEALQKRVVYMDTDSVIYTIGVGEEALPTGTYLGELTNELEDYGPKAYIDEFISAG